MTKEGAQSAVMAMPSIEMMKALHGAWKKCAAELGYDSKDAIPFNFLFSHALSTLPSDSRIGEAFKKQLDKGFEKALTVFLEMKEKELHFQEAVLCIRLNIR